jgi:hypothetical protein
MIPIAQIIIPIAGIQATAIWREFAEWTPFGQEFRQLEQKRADHRNRIVCCCDSRVPRDDAAMNKPNTPPNSDRVPGKGHRTAVDFL